MSKSYAVLDFPGLSGKSVPGIILKWDVAVTYYCTGHNCFGDVVNGSLSSTVRNLLGGEAEVCQHSKGPHRLEKWPGRKLMKLMYSPTRVSMDNFPLHFT